MSLINANTAVRAYKPKIIDFNKLLSYISRIFTWIFLVLMLLLVLLSLCTLRYFMYKCMWSVISLNIDTTFWVLFKCCIKIHSFHTLKIMHSLFKFHDSSVNSEIKYLIFIIVHKSFVIQLLFCLYFHIFFTLNLN